MKNLIYCPKCNTENPHYNFTCNKCNAYIRRRVINIDFWDTTAKLLYSPVNTAKTIIFSEHKNYITIILFFASLKIVLNTLLFSNIMNLGGYDKLTFINIILLSVIQSIIFVIVSFLVTKLNSILGTENRFIDNLTIYTYSYIPLIILLVALTPIQFAIFGNYWFTFNPSPFLIRYGTAIVFTFIEILFQLWTVILLITSSYAQTNNKLYSSVIGIVIFLTIHFISFALIEILL